jgi:hypothetical protein
MATYVPFGNASLKNKPHPATGTRLGDTDRDDDRASGISGLSPCPELQREGGGSLRQNTSSMIREGYEYDLMTDPSKKWRGLEPERVGRIRRRTERSISASVAYQRSLDFASLKATKKAQTPIKPP